MELDTIFSHETLVWVVIPALIFICGLSYVSLGTLRIIFVARGQRFLSPLLGFFEVAIWLFAISQVMANVSNIGTYLAYALGFAVGNYVGIIIEEKMAIGILVVRIIVTGNDEVLRNNLTEAGFGITSIEAKGATGKVEMVYTVVRRKDLQKVTRIIDESHANAFYSVEDARHVREGVFPQRSRRV